MQYTTPGPTALTVRFASGDLRVEAADRPDVEIAVEPYGSSSADRELADATVVEQVGNEIRIIAPDSKGWLRRSASLRVRASVPTGTSTRIAVESADVALTGTLGALDITTASGDVAAERASSFALVAASADVVCRHVDGDASVKTASGDVHLGPVGGDGHLAVASGDLEIESFDGSVDFKSASGDVKIGRVGRSVTGRTASGDVRVLSVGSGTVEADSASGDITIGIAAGVAAWLDLQSVSGDVSSTLDDADAPVAGDATVTVRARTLSGDIRIVRAD